MRVCAAALIIGLAPLVFPAAEEPKTETEDTLEEAVIGVAQFRFNASEARHSFLGANVARLFREKISEIRTHEISGEELPRYAAGIVREEREKILRKIDELAASRDALFFPGAGLRDSDKAASLSSEIETEKKRLKELDGLELSTVKLIREKKLKLLEKPELVEGLLPPALEAHGASSRAGVDYLLWGSLTEEPAGFVSVTASLYARRARFTLFSRRVTGSADEMEALVDRLFSSLAASLTGRPWATLEFKTTPHNARVYVDGKLSGIGNIKLAYVPPGSYKVSVYAEGYESLEENVNLEAGTSVSLSRELTSAPLPLISLDSLPSGADVYLGAIKQGVSPLLLPLGMAPDILRLSMEGHKSKVMPSNSPALGELHILPRDIVGWDSWVQSKRADFYSSLGAFVLSVPLPLIFYGLYQSETLGYIQYISVSGYDRDWARWMQRKTEFMYYGYFGSLFLTTALFANVIQNLVDYIDAGEESRKYPDTRAKEE